MAFFNSDNKYGQDKNNWNLRDPKKAESERQIREAKALAEARQKRSDKYFGWSK